MEGLDTFLDAGWKGHEVTSLRQQPEYGQQALWRGYQLPNGQIQPAARTCDLGAELSASMKDLITHEEAAPVIGEASEGECNLDFLK